MTKDKFAGISTSLSSTESSSHVSLTPITAAFVFEAITINCSLGSTLLALRWIKCKPFRRKQLISSDSTYSMLDGVVVTGKSLKWSSANERASNEHRTME